MKLRFLSIFTKLFKSITKDDKGLSDHGQQYFYDITERVKPHFSSNVKKYMEILYNTHEAESEGQRLVIDMVDMTLDHFPTPQDFMSYADKMNKLKCLRGFCGRVMARKDLDSKKYHLYCMIMVEYRASDVQ